MRRRDHNSDAMVGGVSKSKHRVSWSTTLNYLCFVSVDGNGFSQSHEASNILDRAALDEAVGASRSSR